MTTENNQQYNENNSNELKKAYTHDERSTGT